MSARDELTAALAALRMSEERRRDITRLVERVINEAVDGDLGVRRVSAAYLRGYCDGVTDVERRVFDAVNDAASAVRGVARESVSIARDAYMEHGIRGGAATDLPLDDARAALATATAKAEETKR